MSIHCPIFNFLFGLLLSTRVHNAHAQRKRTHTRTCVPERGNDVHLYAHKYNKG